MNIELSNDENIILQQNVPNPFREKTQIQFYIPNNVSKATIVFYSSRGKMIKEQEISSRGNGSINVYGYDLSKGIYTYSLIVDGKIVKTRKMLKQ